MRLISPSLLLAAAALATPHLLARAPRGGDGTFTVMTFNIQHGIDGSHKYNLQRAIDVIAKVQPDLVGLQEVTRNHPYYECDDQPAKIAAGLTTATGRKWSVAYEQEWFTPNVECQQSGRGDGKETEGLAFLAPGDSVGATKMTALPVSRIGLAVRPAALPNVSVVVTHLASGKQNDAAREKEVAALLPWASKLGPAVIVMGDFNMPIDDPALQPLASRFRDAWQVASQASAASGGGATHGDKRIDFIFYDPAAFDVTRVEAVDTRSWFGSEASDHRPLVATFRVKPRS